MADVQCNGTVMYRNPETRVVPSGWGSLSFMIIKCKNPQIAHYNVCKVDLPVYTWKCKCSH